MNYKQGGEGFLSQNATQERIFKKLFSRLFNERTAFFKSFSIGNAFIFKNKVNGFTLAEVLITLGIIGIVAAMTLPTLVAKYQEKVLVVQVKKTYSELQNALKMYAAKHDCSDISCISDLNSTKEELTKKLFEQFKGAKYCEAGSKEKICKYYEIKGNTPVNNGYGVIQNEDGFIPPFFIASNGASYNLTQYNQCIREQTYNKRDENGYFVDEDKDGIPDTITTTVDYCANIYFDANGPLKGPNQFGADVYRFNITSNGKLSISTTQLNQTLTTDKLYYTPHNIGDELKK